MFPLIEFLRYRRQSEKAETLFVIFVSPEVQADFVNSLRAKRFGVGSGLQDFPLE